MSCDLEDEIEFFGIAQGGGVLVFLSGIQVWVATSPGESAATVAANLASAVNSEALLQSQGISSVAIGGRVVTNGTFDVTGTTDLGITVPEPSVGLMLAAGLMGLLMLDAMRRRRAR